MLFRSGLAPACQRYRDLRAELTAWLEWSERTDGPSINDGGEDEANYALAWFPHYLVTGDERIAQRFRSLLGDLARWVEDRCVHGYPPRAEAHHGTEPFALFLSRYLGVFPGDTLARRLLEDAAHHIGNWVPGIPAWYDFEHGCFHSYFLGTEAVGRSDNDRFECAEHLRFVHIALAAFRTFGQTRYRDWALAYGRRWAERVASAGDRPMPLLWTRDGRGLGFGDLDTRMKRTMAAAAHHLRGDPLAGIDNLLASGAVHVFGDLYALGGDTLFKRAARRIVEPLVGELLDPAADPAAAALGYYRQVFDDFSLDERIGATLRAIPSEQGQPLALVVAQTVAQARPGVGKRADMAHWGYWREDGSVAPFDQPSTAALCLAYQLTGQPAYARRAFGLAATKLAMARRVLRSGREHADMGAAVCSVAAGHGRNWGQGAVTGCYGPLLLGTREALGGVTPALEVHDAHGVQRLPDTLLSLVRTGPAGVEATFFNGGAEAVEFCWRFAGATTWRDFRLAPGQRTAVRR